MRPTVEPSNIESFQWFKVRTRLKAAKQRLRPDIVLPLEKRSYAGEGFCGKAGWFFLSRRAEAGQDEAQCGGKDQNSGPTLLRGKRYLRLNTSSQKAAISRTFYSSSRTKTAIAAFVRLDLEQ